MAYGTLNAGAITPGSGNTLTVSETVNVATSLQLAGTAITSTATEINLLDGSSATNATVSKAVVLDGSGNIAFPTGKGIDFSATADGSGTTTSELLDDYEEGTWDPVASNLASGTPTLTGTYTKIGNFVYGTMLVSGTTTATADTTRFTGLPFTVGTGGFSSWVDTGVSTGGVSQASVTSLITSGWGSASNIKCTFLYTV